MMISPMFTGTIEYCVECYTKGIHSLCSVRYSRSCLVDAADCQICLKVC